jgi:perosamine synthetase
MTSHKPINMFGPYMAPRAIERVSEVLHTPMIGQGQNVDEFERAIQKALKLSYVVAVNNSSSAIRLALDICGVQPGDEVITTALTCTLSNHPILEQFATPVFADVQPDTGNIDPDDVEQRITPKTKAIVCTHWAGTPCDVDELNRIARQHGLAVIEDASEAFGATYRERAIGGHSRFVAFSFHAIQIITASEGGALAVQLAADDGLARMKRWYGIDRVGRQANVRGYYDFDVNCSGYGYYLTNVAAAIGLENLGTLATQQARRGSLAERYWQDLREVPGLTLLRRHDDRCPSYHFFTVLVERRDDFCRKLNEAGIRVSIVHARNDEYSIFGGLRRDLPRLDDFSQHYIGLPLHMGMSDEDIEYVIDVIKHGW